MKKKSKPQKEYQLDIKAIVHDAEKIKEFLQYPKESQKVQK